METFQFLLHPQKLKEGPCFLCFTCNECNLDVDTVFEIRNEFEVICLSLAEMFRNLFPNQDLVFRNACDDCSDLISKLYVLFNKRKNQKKLLDCILKQLFTMTDEICKTQGLSNDKIILNVQIPSDNIVRNNTQSIANSDDSNCFGELVHDAPKVTNGISDMSCDTMEHLDCETVKLCPYCPEIFQGEHEFSIHLKSHEPEQNTQQKRQRRCKYHYCNDCNYKTLCKSTLQAHINKKHLCTRPYVCQVCSKGFYRRSNLNEHLNTHNSKRNEVCEMCGCSFIHKKSLLEHLRLHTDTRPYECDICGKKFITSGRRSDHIKRSHMERTESCVICDKKYSLKKELTRHMNNVHLKSMEVKY